MGYLSLLSELASVGVTRAQLSKAVVESVEVREQVIATTKAAAAYWKSILPGPNPAKPHELYKGDGTLIEPGSLKKAVKTRDEKDRSGALVGVIYIDEAVAPQAALVEYGGKNNPVGGYAQKVADRFNGEMA